MWLEHSQAILQKRQPFSPIIISHEIRKEWRPINCNLCRIDATAPLTSRRTVKDPQVVLSLLPTAVPAPVPAVPLNHHRSTILHYLHHCPNVTLSSVLIPPRPVRATDNTQTYTQLHTCSAVDIDVCTVSTARGELPWPHPSNTDSSCNRVSARGCHIRGTPQNVNTAQLYIRPRPARTQRFSVLFCDMSDNTWLRCDHVCTYTRNNYITLF